MAHAEVNVTSLRRAKIPQLGKLNKEMMLDALEEIEERRDQEILSIQNYQHLAESYYNMKVRASPWNLTTSSWEKRAGVYQLETLFGELVPRTLNSMILKRSYNRKHFYSLKK